MEEAIHTARTKIIATLCAVLAAVFYAISMPASKVLLQTVEPTMMAALLYLGAGFGIGGLFLVSRKKLRRDELLEKEDPPYVLGMIALILMLIGSAVIVVDTLIPHQHIPSKKTTIQ